MISPDKALATVLEKSRPLEGDEKIPIDQACGRVLATGIVADRDIPPFHKVCMDGFAFRHDATDARTPLRVVGEVAAGSCFEREIGAQQVVSVMTGAPLPPGTDTVVPVEHTTVDGDAVVIERLPEPFRNVAPKGSDCREDQTVLTAGMVVTPTGVAVLATVGLEEVRVRRTPRVAIVASGDEIVRPSAPVGPGQIRDSNSYSLASQARLAGVEQVTMEHAPDNQNVLRKVLEGALKSDLVIISGGVSVGQYDLVPPTLTSLGVTCHFHEVAQKPGKPLWFGSIGTTLVFGAPGNPLATVLTFDRYILPAIRKMSGQSTERAAFSGRLTHAVTAKKGSRDTFFFARAEPNEMGRYQLQPLSRTGAADVFGTSEANAIFRLSPGARVDKGADVIFSLMGLFEGAF